jgi:glucose/mannose-6-phosphate isomerase
MNPYKENDYGNMYDVLVDFSDQIKAAWNNKFKVKISDYKSIKNIILTGLGGSAISGDIAKTFLNTSLKLPFQVNRDYPLPNSANHNTLVLACSYSGDTEETISAYKMALARDCKLVSIGSGGEIEKLSRENQKLHIKVPSGFQPRCALGLMFFNLLKFLNDAHITSIDNSLIDSIFKILKDKSEMYSKENSKPYEDAQKLIGFFPVIHSSELLQSINVRFRCQLAENSKVLSYSSTIPELNHNEIIGWEKYDSKKFNAKVIQIIDENDHPRNRLRFEITEKILRDSGVEVIKIKSSEKSFEERIIDLIYYTDWISFYLAVLRKIDPTPIKYINTLKNSLAAIQN